MTAHQDSLRRLLAYAKRHGFRGTLQRLKLSLQRLRVGNDYILFSCDLRTFVPLQPDSLADSPVQRITEAVEVASPDLTQIVNFWNPEVTRRQIAERFQHGASLWLFKRNGKLAAYGWTLAGKSIERHFFPLDPEDVHLFDFFVFPEFRGKRINITLMNHILAVLASERKNRALIEAAAWNTAQLSSLKRSPFQLLGRAKRSPFTGKARVIWNNRAAK